MENVSPLSAARPDDGDCLALGYLQIGAATLTLVMSLMAFVPAMQGNAELLDPVKVVGLSSGILNQFLVAYVSLQLSVGWIAGALQLAAGIRCLNGRSPRLVAVASVVNLCNIPHGAIAAVVALRSLRLRDLAPEIARPAAGPRADPAA